VAKCRTERNQSLHRAYRLKVMRQNKDVPTYTYYAHVQNRHCN